ncbi:MAG TPA: hypothetical protein VF482_09210 [Trebonia sp.]
MPIPTWSVGQVLAASDVDNWFVPLAAYKTGNTTRSATSLASDPDLTLNVAASAVYDVRCYVLYSGAAATGMNFGFTAPAGVSGSYGTLYNVSGTGTTGSAWVWSATPNTAGTPAGNSLIIIEGTLITGVTAGVLAFQWASNTGGNNVTVINGSKLTARRVG